MDNLIAGGANLMCQIVLAVIEDVKIRLRTRKKKLPRKVFFQFDNSGENKNKTMFAMLSHLIEEHYFDEIHCNFLMVGHTHCSIDQNFGVLSECIGKKRFIGSPLALWNLLDTAHTDPKRRPTVNRKISIIYDFASFFEPKINKEIKWFKVPHCFKLYRILGKAVTQYKLFSTNKVWLPEPPEDSILNVEDDLFDHLLTEVPLSRYCIIDGEDRWHEVVGIKDKNLKDSLNDKKLQTITNILRQLSPTLENLERESLDQQDQR